MVVKCPGCGADNPDGYTNCSSCRAELGRVAPQAPAPTGSRRCVACGRELAWDANVCPYCGRDYRFPHPQMMRKEEPVSTGMKILLYLVSFFIPLAGFVVGAIYYTKEGEEYKRIGKFCIILAILSILLSIAMAAALYAVVLGLGGHGLDTPSSFLVRTTITSGYKFTFTPVTADTAWSEVTVILSDGAYSTHWSPVTGQLIGEGFQVSELGDRMLGLMEVWCNVTDLAGNGAINNGDYFTLTTSSSGFVSGTTYTVTVMYEPTDGSVCHSTFIA